MEQKTLRTSIQSALLQGFTVLRTRNAEDTARQLAGLTRALERQCRARAALLARSRAEAPQAAGAAGANDNGARRDGDDDDDPLLTYPDWEAGLKSTAADMKVAAMWGLMLTAVPGEAGDGSGGRGQGKVPGKRRQARRHGRAGILEQTRLHTSAAARNRRLGLGRSSSPMRCL